MTAIAADGSTFPRNEKAPGKTTKYYFDQENQFLNER
jgi:hypothetical protein